MDAALIIIGALVVGCIFVLFMTITVHGTKISDLQKALAKLHFKTLNMESDINVSKKQPTRNLNRNKKYQEPRVKREVVYKIPKRISGDLTMENEGKSASVKAVFKVKGTE